MEEAVVAPGWYLNTSTGLQQYWDGNSWSEIPAPAQIDGQPLGVAKGETADIAIIAFVFSLLVPFVGWILGFKARREIADSQGKKTGRPLATAAIWIGGIVTVGVAAMIALCALTSIAFTDRFDHGYNLREYRYHMLDQNGGQSFGGMMNPDGSGSVTITPRGGMMNPDGSGTVTVDPRGGMMFGDQTSQDFSSGPVVTN